MSKVIKNNDGVAVVEGTPAASLIKDVDKFFALKPNKRMAGEAIKPQTLSAERLTKSSEEPMPVLETLRERSKFERPAEEPIPVSETLREGSKFSEPAMKTNEEEKNTQEKEIKREEALDKTREFKRLRYAERSADEQEATRGAFISTLQT